MGAEAEGFERMYRSTYPAVLAYVRRRVAADAVDDVVAETFLAAWRHQSALPAEPLPWLYRAAWLSISTAHRTASRRAALTVHLERLRDDAVDPADDALARRIEIGEALGRLAEADQEVLRLRYWEDLTGAELGVALGCSGPAARVRLHRARGRLAAVLRPSATPDPPVTAQISSIREVGSA